ncbi:ferritin [Macrococcoides caseolyticum]|uniref:Ferritin n=1 Tax=Macrococcoides caseolyticum TaxID=69966 RepID=A0ACC9MQ22_9STAP|nr:ferritin [Macrococcus caseolyticus]PKE17425.1 ferritin [Macrococcus caseolyticus]PKE19465.1 ferritin [Macrococcus caseolyticus]PKE38676.1 ferritin [Macrococcus caseolyticus]PKE55777.1 ferritin [Macrococcus caseolyticus]PKE68364.1 ferritin [Macrococcus caseolyticus]
MLSQTLTDALNKQMNEEFQAAHAYMAMAAYCAKESYDGFANFYEQQAEEERFHGTKIYNYLNDRDQHAIFSEIKAPKTDFATILDTFEAGLAQEQQVTKNFYNLAELAKNDNEYATISFLNWFLDEQVEEEAMFKKHIDYIRRIKDDANALYLYEKELGKRDFQSE